MKKTSYFFIAVVILFTFVVAGCATRGDLQQLGRKLVDDTSEALTSLTSRVATLESRDAAKAKRVGALENTLDSFATQTKLLIADTKKSVQALEERVDRTEYLATENEARVSDLETRVSTVEAQIKKVRVRATSAHRTAGAALEFAGRGGRYFQIGPFSLGSAEVRESVVKQLATLKTLMKEKDLEAVQITGFADEAGYKEESEQKNQELSEKRAAAVAEFLMPYLGGAVVVEGRGSTAQFGDRSVNRSVVVEVMSRETTAAVTPPTPAPTVPATSAPATIAPAPAAPAPAVPTAPSPAPTAPAPAPTAPATPPPAGNP